jgi:heme-degrading monooxygenase HmoA
MVVTTLSANVAADKVAPLEAAFQSAVGTLDAGIVETFLLHDARDVTAWRIVTVWESRAALDAMRATGQTPRGVQIFREAGAEPVLSIQDVRVRGAR